MMVLVHFGTYMPQIKWKYYQNPTFSQKTTSLQLSNKTSSRSYINLRILIKLFKKNPFFGPKMDFLKKKNWPVNKDHEVRGQVSTTFSEFPNLGLTDSEKFFVVARLKFIPVLVSFFHFHTFCFDFGWFLGVMPIKEKKNLLDSHMQNFMLNVLEKKCL